MAPSKPYAGPVRRLLLEFDVGTTYSGIEYDVLDTGEVPKIKEVTRKVIIYCGETITLIFH